MRKNQGIHGREIQGVEGVARGTQGPGGVAFEIQLQRGGCRGAGAIARKEQDHPNLFVQHPPQVNLKFCKK